MVIPSGVRPSQAGLWRVLLLVVVEVVGERVVLESSPIVEQARGRRYQDPCQGVRERPNREGWSVSLALPPVVSCLFCKIMALLARSRLNSP